MTSKVMDLKIHRTAYFGSMAVIGISIFLLFFAFIGWIKNNIAAHEEYQGIRQNYQALADLAQNKNISFDEFVVYAKRNATLGTRNEITGAIAADWKNVVESKKKAMQFEKYAERSFGLFSFSVFTIMAVFGALKFLPFFQYVDCPCCNAKLPLKYSRNCGHCGKPTTFPVFVPHWCGEYKAFYSCPECKEEVKIVAR